VRFKVGVAQNLGNAYFVPLPSTALSNLIPIAALALKRVMS